MRIVKVLQFCAIGIVILCLGGQFTCGGSSLNPEHFTAKIQTKDSKPPKAVQKEMPPHVKAFISSFNDHFEKAGKNSNTVGSAIAIVKDGEVIFQKGYGRRIAGSPAQVDTNTVFRIGSLSKGFASTLTGIMVERGLLGWNNQVQEYIPQFSLRSPRQASEMQIQHLLSHTTGLSYHAHSNQIEQNRPISQLIDQYFPKTKTYYPVGQRYAYQNAAYSLIQPILEKVNDGKSYQSLLESEIFLKLNMRTASTSFAELNAVDNKAYPHKYYGKRLRPFPILDNYYGDYCAAGGINASIADMGKFLGLLMGSHPDLLSPITREQLFMPLVDTGNERRVLQPWIDRRDCHYGLGLRVLYTPNDDTIVYHGGYVNGYHSEIAFSRKHDIGIVFLANAKTQLAGDAIIDFFQMWERYCRQS